MDVRKSLGLVLGYGLLAGGVLLVLNAVKVVATAILTPTAPAWAVVAALMVHGGAIILCYAFGKLVLQRVHHPSHVLGVDTDWGRVLGP